MPNTIALLPVAKNPVSEEIAKRVPNSVMKLIEGGHAFNNEAPSSFNGALLEFFGKH